MLVLLCLFGSTNVFSKQPLTKEQRDIKEAFRQEARSKREVREYMSEVNNAEFVLDCAYKAKRVLNKIVSVYKDSEKMSEAIESEDIVKNEEKKGLNNGK